MRRLPAFIAGIVIFLLLPVGAYFWATGLIDGMYAFRSPLHDNPPQPGAALGQPATRQVVFVVVDALRYDTSMKTGVMPVLNQLRQQGASARMHSRTPSFSQPGYSCLFIGAWPNVSDGPALNQDVFEKIPTWTQDNLFSAAARAGFKTAVSADRSFQKLIPQNAVAVSYYTTGSDQASDQQVVAAALPWLASDQYRLTFIQLSQVDYAGEKQGGPRDPHWDQAAARADALLGEILSKLDLSKDTILVVADHGQIDAGGHGGPEAINLLEPFVLAGAGVKPGDYGDVQQVDVAPTIAALLGTNLPASTQGQVQVQALDLPATTLSALPAAIAAQQSQLVTDYTRAIGQVVSVPEGSDVAEYQSVLNAARNSRLNSERLPRGILSVIIIALPLYLILRHRRKTMLWFLTGALIYAALFNLSYVVLEGKTYSLSSVTDEMSLILSVAIPAAVALVIAWLNTALGSGMFRQAPLPAARAAQGLFSITIYLLLIPILVHFTWNGAVPTWSLPEMWTAFVALLSMVQILIVAVLGLVLVGITSLIAAKMVHQQAINLIN